jgi:hypothetical protein
VNSSDFIEDMKMALSAKSNHNDFMVDNKFGVMNKYFFRVEGLQMDSKIVAEL